jgi:hypothetical protein
VFLTIRFVFIHSLVAADFSGIIVGVIDGDTIEGQRHPSSNDVPAWGRQKAGGYGCPCARSTRTIKQCTSDARTMGHPTHRLFESTATGNEEKKERGVLDARGEGLPYSPPIPPAQQEERVNKKNEESLDD